MNLGIYQHIAADFSIFSGGVPVIVSGYDRSLQVLKGFGGTLSFSNGTLEMEPEEMEDGFRRRGMVAGQQYLCYYSPIRRGKEKFYHMVGINETLRGGMANGTGRFLTTRDRAADSFYDWLMENYSLPLMRKWAEELYGYCRENGYLIDDTEVYRSKNTHTSMIEWGGEKVDIGRLTVVSVSGLTPQKLQTVVKELFSLGRICITQTRQEKLEFKDMDQYFQKYGAKLVENLKSQIQPLAELDGEVKDFTLKHLWMYPQQAAQVNGGISLIEKNRYLIMNHGMGTGKTLCGAALCEGYFGRKWLKSHPGKTLKDLYMDPDNLAYRNIVMAPGHLVKKWAREIEENIPYSHVEILDDFSKLIQLREGGRTRQGREWFVVSKDFGKLSYQEKPAPTKMRKRPVYLKKCRKCRASIETVQNYCTRCGEDVPVFFQTTGEQRNGMICPDCNRLLFSSGSDVEKELGEEDRTGILLPSDFATHTTSNDECFYCGAKLWTPNVKNIGTQSESVWKRVTAWSNKAHKGKKTLWIHEDYVTETVQDLELEVISIKEAKGVRKFSPTLFIKKYMRGFFDIAIFDEAHMYKGGGTGQGHAMHCLVKASRKQLALTGTIAGGYANHLFYLLWRLEPQRMVEKGYTFHSEMQFCGDYGCVERRFEVADGKSEDGDYNTCCRGRQLTSPKVKPGISPLIFMDFLLDRCTFLDLSDMSRYLPALKEKVVEVFPEGELEESVYFRYQKVCRDLMEMSRKGEGRGLLGVALQFGLSFMDKPYGVPPIKSPRFGSILARVPNEEALEGTLLSKEKALIDIVKSELSEGRNCVVYAEYTASPETCISYRLKEIIERECGLEGKVAVLESSSPAPAKREEWMHAQARAGVKVFITNPRCVETGLDFCWSEDGVEYNYPTLIFYQMGSSMFTISQASRRHYRLNQRKECRTYYMAWSGTPQAAMIKLIAEKQVATSAIQGKFSTEGLAAMAAGVDTRVKLAAAMSGQDDQTGNDLQAMFDVLNTEESEDSELDSSKRMLLLHELLGGDVPSQRTIAEMEQQKGFDLFDLLFMEEHGEVKKAGTVSETAEEPVRTVEDIQAAEISCVMMDVSQLPKKKKIKAGGQFAIMW